MKPIWIWSPPPAGPSLIFEPLLTTPVITNEGTAVFLHKGRNQLFALDITQNPPVELPWSGLNLCTLPIPQPENITYPPKFCSWSEDHALSYYGGKVWIPSNDYFGILLVDPLSGGWITTTGLADNTHRFTGSAGGHAKLWTGLIFNIVHAEYGLITMLPDGTRFWTSSAEFNGASEEFSHPVSISLSGANYDWYCVISTELSGVGGIFISGTNSISGFACAVCITVYLLVV
jgi:hypothetical protein